MNEDDQRRAKIARPLKVVIPLIQSELQQGNSAGREHYLRAGEMLLEAKDQVGCGRWGQWLAKNFDLSQRTALSYTQWARDHRDFASGASNEHDQRRAELEAFRSKLAEALGREMVLRAENERLRLDARAYANVMLSEENDALIDENTRLQIELKAAQTGIGALQGTVERLRGMLQAFIDDPAMNVGRDVRERVQRALNETAGG